MEKIRKWLLDNEPLVIILLLVAALRIPSLLEPLWYGDEGIYMVMGQALRKGLVWYKEIHDNKPPLLYLLAAAGGGLMWVRFMLLWWNLANILVVWLLAKKILKRTLWQTIVTLIFALLTSLPLIEGNIANGEIFMIMPVAAAVLVLLGGEGYQKGKMLIVGLLLATGFLFKVPAAFDALAIGIFILTAWGKGSEKKFEGLVYLGIGFLLPVAVSIGYYFIKGAGWEYVNAAFLQNVGYLSSWSGERKPIWQSGIAIRGLVAVVMSVLVVVSLKSKPKAKLLGLWLIWSTFGAFLSERPYPHYLIQMAAPVALGLGLLIETKSKAVSVALMGVGMVMVVGIIMIKFTTYEVFSYYQKAIKMVVEKQSLEEFQNKFEYRVKRNREIAEYLRMATTKDEKIFVWGDEPAIYVLSERLPVGRYSVAYHVIDFRAQEETMKALVSEKPKYIVMLGSEKRELLGLGGLIESDYLMTEQIEDAVVFRRIAKN